MTVRTRLAGAFLIVAAFTAAGCQSQVSSLPTTTPAPSSVAAVAPVAPPTVAPTTTTATPYSPNASGSTIGDGSGSNSSSGSASSGGSGSGDGYINSDGNYEPSPESASSAPPGATAQCKDGTYSHSQHHSGTCSGHGGVAQWL